MGGRKSRRVWVSTRARGVKRTEAEKKSKATRKRQNDETTTTSRKSSSLSHSPLPPLPTSSNQFKPETENDFQILADVPGVEHSRVNLLVDGDVVSLEVTEEHEKKEEDPATRYYRSERSSSFQSRSVRLPPSAKMEELRADVEHGVLKVVVPKEKKEEEGKKGPRRIKVGSGGGGGGVISAEETSPAAAGGGNKTSEEKNK
jgi:HSP20 family molecular chaperone IbpA